ncbi:MAG: hypothetical protein QW165_01760 [Candidatus Woesearchaeota archaeon]
MNLLQKIATCGTIAAVAAFGAAHLSRCDRKEVPNPTVAEKQEPKIEDIAVPEKPAPAVQPKEEPKVVPKEEPKQEPPKWEAKPVVYKALVTYDKPSTREIAMEQWRIEVAYRQITGEPVQNSPFARIYRFSKEAGADEVVQYAEIKSDIERLEKKVAELKRKNDEEYKQLNMKELTITDKVTDEASILILPATETQEKRLRALQLYKTAEQRAYIAAMINMHSEGGSITEDKLAIIEDKVAEKYGGKK